MSSGGSLVLSQGVKSVGCITSSIRSTSSSGGGNKTLVSSLDAFVVSLGSLVDTVGTSLVTKTTTHHSSRSNVLFRGSSVGR